MTKKNIFHIVLTGLTLGLIAIFIQTASSSSLNLSFIPDLVLNDEISMEAQKALAYIAQNEGIAPEDLVIVNEFPRASELLARTFQAVTLLDTAGDHFFSLLVDKETGEVLENEAILAAEEHAYNLKYGKLQPELYEHLQTMQDDDTVLVTIWVAAPPGKSVSEREQEAMATLAAKYPEAQAAIELNGKPMDVEDPELAEQIYKEYVALMRGGMNERVQPLVDALEAQGVEVQTTDGLPAVTATLSKETILELAEREEVGSIYLAEGGERRPALDSSTPANRAHSVWQRGFNGLGVKIAILENGNVDFTSNTTDCPSSSNNCFVYPGLSTPGSGIIADDEHATVVASAAASNHSTHTGMASNATIMSAGINGSTRQHDINALVWALNNGADVINASYAWEICTNQMDIIDRAFDHYARIEHRFFAVVAGNNIGCTYPYILSPGKGWNLLTVGAYDNLNSVQWSDDIMWNNSLWGNPASLDREKPEVVAPGVHVVGIKRNGIFSTNDSYLHTGTSIASPQVAGLAALLIHRNVALRVWPEASRAIIMASAVHNIDGPQNIPTGQDLKDGAGGIDASLADTIASIRSMSDTSPCQSPCWWGININNTGFPKKTYLYRYFLANRGERIRVAISWWSYADCPSESNCNYDGLDTDLQLGVKDPAGNWVPGAWTASHDNNYELVDFIAPMTGEYKIAVYKERADETSNFLGIAWVKMATYIPYFWSSNSGIDTTLYIRNDDAEPKPVTVSVFNDAGNYVYGATQTINPNAVWSYNPTNNNTTHYTAVVSGSEDISVVSVQKYIGYDSYAAFTGVSHPTTTDFIPIVHKNNSGYNQHIFIQNTSGTVATVTIEFKVGTAGSNCTLSNIPIPANGRYYVSTANLSCLGTTFIGSAYISSSQPIATLGVQYKGSTSILHASNDQNAALKAFAPLIQNNNSGYYSGFAEQNASASTQTLWASFFHGKTQGVFQNGSFCSNASQSTTAYKSYIVNASPGSNCASIANAEYYGTSNGNVTVNVNQIAPGVNNFATDYRAITAPGYMVTIPYMEMYNGNWVGGFAVRNTTTNPTTITISLYALDGTLINYNNGGQQNPLSITLGSRETYICNPGTSTCFSYLTNTKGSVVITSSNAPIAVVVNNMLINSSYDGLMTYEGIHR